MHLYAFAAAPISAGFRNRLCLAMILSGKGVARNCFLDFAPACPENDVHIVSTSNERLLNMNESLPQPLSSSPDRNINEI